jgi:hypothetical protein
MTLLFIKRRFFNQFKNTQGSRNGLNFPACPEQG